MTFDPKKSYILFYDLETTDLCPVGQILNFAFVVTDHDYNEVEELKGTVALSPTQLPNPYAILANRIDVIEHQKTATYSTEKAAMDEIAAFITYYKEQSQQPIYVVGYNSTRFDLLFLRTSMTRNGVNPYIGSANAATRYDKDVLHIGQYVATQNEEFKKKFTTKEGKVSLRLENVCKTLGLLEGKQLHESRADVDLTIKLAQYYLENYNIHIADFEAYQAYDYEAPGVVIQKLHPNDDKHHHDSDDNNTGPGRMAFLDGGNRDRKGQSLWIDLDKWKAGKGRDAISWYNRFTSTFFFGGKLTVEPEQVEQARKDLAHINLLNYFPDKNCDPESWIYMLDLDRANELAAVINRQKNISEVTEYKVVRGVRQGPLDKKGYTNLIRIYKRFVINNTKNHDQEYEELVKGYAMYRYGGKLKTNRYDCVSVYQPGVYSSDFHATWNELIADIKKLQTEKTGEDLHLLQQLEKYYYSSDIYRLAGKELEKINREKKTP